MMSGVLSEIPDNELNHSLRELNQLSGAIEMSVWSTEGQLITSSVENPAIMVPNKPDEAIFRQLAQQEDYIGLDPSEENDLKLRAAVNIPNKLLARQAIILHVIFPVNDRLSALGKTVQDAYTDYKELSYLRKPLISIFTLTLSMIVLLTILASIWFAVLISRRIVHPLQELADGTQSVASGNYNTQLTTSNHDEIGFLVRSFNQMTQRLTHERNASQRSHRMLEQQSSYLGAVLGSLSSGVITLDDELRLKTANVAASAILDVQLSHLLELPLEQIGARHAHLSEFTRMVFVHVEQNQHWHHQLELHPKQRRQTLMCHGTLLPSNTGWVIVFDDITTLLQAQRNAAWGEVAKRLAHEIKNPLTPIQLSAERLQHKYNRLLPDDQTELLNKLTNTIIQQVESMKSMVNDFSDYAKNPGIQLSKQNMFDLVKQVIDLYQSNRQHTITLSETSGNIIANVDSNRFRQVLHNLLKNAIEASEEAQLPVAINIGCAQIKHNHKPWLQITVSDTGPGIPEDMLTKMFEPYATNKLKGTGLGLAIVKKIIDEHHGVVWAENNAKNGAAIIIRLPLEDPEL
jgi:nitrogen fixation/metabolism regulation signal transduction histidine kinase